MVKYIIDDPIRWNESKAKHQFATTKTTIKVFETNSGLDSIKYVGDVTYKGRVWNFGTADSVGVITLTRRREAVDPTTNLFDNITGDDLADVRHRITFALPGVDADGTAASVAFTLRMKGIAKLKYLDDFIMQGQCREGNFEMAGDITWSIGKNVKKVVKAFKKRS